ncbi:MAG: DUF4089 domain-containing protein [Hyphomicrobiaceae bacterium]|nr:DUF4089 domain-containing protein [Hyphomicrobiaceae bacterium]
MGRSQNDVCESHRAAMAEVLGLNHLPPEWNASVTGYLVMASSAADLFLTFPLDEIFDEAAPIFMPQPVHGEDTA